jgi:hypothetical protein
MLINVRTEIVMVWLQGGFAKPLEKPFNYKNCFDALFGVCFRPSLSLSSQLLVFYVDFDLGAQMVCEEGPFLPHARHRT